MDAVVITKRPRLRQPYLVVAWPGMGDVAFRSAMYLVETLKAQECAHIVAEPFFYLTGSVVHQGLLTAPSLPQGKFYYWKHKEGKRDLLIFVSNGQPDLGKADAYCRCISYVAKAFRVKTVVGFAAMPQPIDHSQAPTVWAAATSKPLHEALTKLEMRMLPDGQVSGMNGLYLGLAQRDGIEGFCLLGEIPPYTIQIENPKASQAVLEAFAKITGIAPDLEGLRVQGETLEGEINKLLDYLKVGTPEGPIGEEEIEKIKKSLSQLTKLPASVKEKIEHLFSESQKDISRAHELKTELDRWNVYKEYEDRFLDLFKGHQRDRN